MPCPVNGRPGQFTGTMHHGSGSPAGGALQVLSRSPPGMSLVVVMTGGHIGPHHTEPYFHSASNGLRIEFQCLNRIEPVAASAQTDVAINSFRSEGNSNPHGAFKTVSIRRDRRAHDDPRRLDRSCAAIRAARLLDASDSRSLRARFLRRSI